MKLSFPLAAVFAAMLSLTACGGGGGGGGTSGGESANLGGKIKIVSDTAGTGATAATGNRVQVNYTGWLYSATATNNKGKQFDSNMVSGGKPLLVKIGAIVPPEKVLTGFEQAVQGMKVGGKRTVIIPSSLAYEAAGIPGTIPGNADLVFDVELTKVCASSVVGDSC
jgi:FKBP-type peptidyl-prolyl cis-trans isomerase FkpA